MKIVFICNNKTKFNRVYDERVLNRLGFSKCGIARISERDFSKYEKELREAEIVFSTWGMPKISEEKIKQYLPNLKAVFYAAGSVGYFAEPFLNLGIKVFSAASANGIPVAEYTSAQIKLALKGYFQSAKNYRTLLPVAKINSEKYRGNYKATVGIVGLGVIGSSVAKKIAGNDIKILAYDPFASQKYAAGLGAELCDLETLFAQSDVITNHLANKKELNNIFGHKLFKLMKKNSTFINTGRGAQVNEFALAFALLSHPLRTAVVDVIKTEVCPIISPLWWCPNAIMTPHIAGSTGYETTRLADYMIDEYNIFISGGKPESEVTKVKLERMA